MPRFPNDWRHNGIAVHHSSSMTWRFKLQTEAALHAHGWRSKDPLEDLQRAEGALCLPQKHDYSDNRRPMNLNAGAHTAGNDRLQRCVDSISLFQLPAQSWEPAQACNPEWGRACFRNPSGEKYCGMSTESERERSGRSMFWWRQELCRRAEGTVVVHGTVRRRGCQELADGPSWPVAMNQVFGAPALMQRLPRFDNARTTSLRLCCSGEHPV